MLKNALIGVGLIAAFGVAYVRYAPLYPNQWHVDPATVERTGKPNDFLMAGGGDQPPAVFAADVVTVAAALDAVVASEPATFVMAGAASDGFVTYVQRSKLMGFPDMISITIQPVEGGTMMNAYARARDGHSDLGVNAARMTRWIAALEARLGSGG